MTARGHPRKFQRPCHLADPQLPTETSHGQTDRHQEFVSDLLRGPCRQTPPTPANSWEPLGISEIPTSLNKDARLCQDASATQTSVLSRCSQSPSQASLCSCVMSHLSSSEQCPLEGRDCLERGGMVPGPQVLNKYLGKGTVQGNRPETRKWRRMGRSETLTHCLVLSTLCTVNCISLRVRNHEYRLFLLSTCLIPTKHQGLRGGPCALGLREREEPPLYRAVLRCPYLMRGQA